MKFKPEDFLDINNSLKDHYLREAIAAAANAKLEEWLKTPSSFKSKSDFKRVKIMAESLKKQAKPRSSSKKK
jgi:hypothetical protein